MAFARTIEMSKIGAWLSYKRHDDCGADASLMYHWHCVACALNAGRANLCWAQTERFVAWRAEQLLHMAELTCYSASFVASSTLHLTSPLYSHVMGLPSAILSMSSTFMLHYHLPAHHAGDAMLSMHGVAWFYATHLPLPALPSHSYKLRSFFPLSAKPAHGSMVTPPGVTGGTVRTQL